MKMIDRMIDKTGEKEFRLRYSDLKIIEFQAKQEVYDNWIERLSSVDKHKNPIFPLAGQEFRNKVIEFIKDEKRHLSTFPSEKETNSSLIQDCNTHLCKHNIKKICQLKVKECPFHNESSPK